VESSQRHALLINYRQPNCGERYY